MRTIDPSAFSTSSLQRRTYRFRLPRTVTLPFWYRGRAIELLPAVARPPFPVSLESVTPWSSICSISGSLPLQPCTDVPWVETPIFSKAEARDSVHGSASRALVNPRDRDLQEIRHFLDR